MASVHMWMCHSRPGWPWHALQHAPLGLVLNKLCVLQGEHDRFKLSDVRETKNLLPIAYKMTYHKSKKNHSNFKN